MANLQANLRSQCATALDRPDRLLCSVNQLFCDNTPEGAYATLFFTEYDERLGRLRYANCGHLCALLLRDDGNVERLESTSTVLGIFKKWECSVVESAFFPGDMLALYTDGVTEAFNEAGEEFGEERLLRSLQEHRELPSRAVLAAVLDDVQKFSPHEQYDDITLIVGKRTPGARDTQASFGF
jgi:serine phosphatase RsbU (regulator of sigma subunit)